MSNILIVTRHTGLARYITEVLEKRGVPDALAIEILPSATPSDIRGRDVWGVLPQKLVGLTRTFTEVPIKTPQELQAFELTIEDVRRYAGKPVVHRVQEMREASII